MSKVICSGCKKTMVDGPEPATEGTCPPCIDEVIEDLKTGETLKWKMVHGLPRRKMDV